MTCFVNGRNRLKGFITDLISDRIYARFKRVDRWIKTSYSSLIKTAINSTVPVTSAWFDFRH